MEFNSLCPKNKKSHRSPQPKAFYVLNLTSETDKIFMIVAINAIQFII